MQVLFATGSPPAYMHPPQLGDGQVNCGPDWSDETGPDGRVTSLKTPEGPYDLAAIAARLPADQQPDLVACLVDSSRRSLPRNLTAFKCPRVLLIADTHHLASPLIATLRYISSEPFDRIVVIYDRHHAAFLSGAGLRNLYWFPGLTFAHRDEAVRSARKQGGRTPRIAFVGQSGKHHPRRSRLLDGMKSAGLPLAQQSIAQDAALGYYGESLIGFNASLNGDLNLRVFEILSSGAALLTDRLAPQAGLSRLLADGREIITYGSQDELLEKAARLVTRPEEALAIGAAGARWFDANFGETWRRAAFVDLAFSGTEVPGFEFSPAERSRVFFGGDISLLLRGMIVFEAVQELHRIQETVHVSLDSSLPGDFAEMFSTLPRVALNQGNVADDMAVIGCANLKGAAVSRARNLWCWDAKPADVEGLARELAPQGLALASRDVALFSMVASPEPDMTAATLCEKGRAQFAKGDLKGALGYAHAALTKDSKCVAALELFGEIALAGNRAPIAESLLSKAVALQPHEYSLEALLGEVLRVQGKLGPAARCFQRVLRGRAHDLTSLLGLAMVRTAESKHSDAELLLRRAARHHPSSSRAFQELGNCLKRRGAVLEALGWHRKALGYAEPIRVPARGGRRRALFVVQHPSTWSSMASIFAAFRGDPHWETTLVALPYNHPYFPDPSDRDAIFGFLEKESLSFIRWDRFALKPDCADVLFLQNPYDVTRPAGWRTQDLLRVVPRLAYAPYAIEIGGTSEDIMHQFNQPLQNLAWAVFARSEEHRALFARHGAVGNSHVIATGHPKFDLLCNLPPNPPESELSAFAKGRPVVLWNPQFDIRADGSGYSTFLTWWKFLPEEFARRPELAFVIRPHPLFFSTLEARKLLTKAQVDEFLKRCRDAGNIHIDRSPTYMAVFAAADAMISDGSSFLIEFGATGKPVCYLHNARGPLAHLAYEVDLDFVRKECVWAEREEEIRHFLDGVKAADSAALAERAAAARRLLSVNAGGAGEAIKREVDERLDAEMRAARPLDVARSAESAQKGAIDLASGGGWASALRRPGHEFSVTPENPAIAQSTTGAPAWS